MKQLRRDKRGFTLVEVIVVLVILAILAAILIPALTGWIDDAKKKICVSNRSQLLRYYEEEQHLHYLDKGADGVLLSEVLAGNVYPETAGDVKAAKCPSNGAYTATADGKKVNCSVHGVTGALNAGKEISSALAALKALDSKKVTSNYDSTVPEVFLADKDGNTTAKKTFVGLLYENNPALKTLLQNAGIASWKSSTKDGIFWTDQDISQAEPDTWVRAMKYNTALGTYTAGYIKVGQEANKEDGSGNRYGTIHVMLPNNWVEAKQQTNDTKKDFDVTEAFYESLTAQSKTKPAG